jgi:hypothetical protein
MHRKISFQCRQVGLLISLVHQVLNHTPSLPPPLLSFFSDNKDLELLRLLSRCILRLSRPSVSRQGKHDAPLKAAVKRLSELEASISLSFNCSPRRLDLDNNPLPLPPHRSSSVHQLVTSSLGGDVHTWGRTVEDLWSSMMQDSNIEERTIWDELCFRLLLFRSLEPGQQSSIGEWLRKETIVLARSLL